MCRVREWRLLSSLITSAKEEAVVIDYDGMNAIRHQLQQLKNQLKVV